MKRYESSEAKCPFYNHESSCNIYCEGLGEKSSIILCLASKQRKEQHRNQYCGTFDYKSCPLYGAINKKYGRWDRNTST